MNISILRLCDKGLCLILFSAVTVGIAFTVSLAEESEGQVKETPSSTAGRTIVINPETGEIDPSAKTVFPRATQKSVQPTTVREEFTHRKDGTVIVNFNGKFMKPLYGHMDENGKVDISHEPEGKE